MDKNPDEETLLRWHRDPDNWKWGVFYVNRHDRRIIVLKRNGMMGITFNYAHPVSFALTFALVAAAIIAAISVGKLNK